MACTVLHVAIRTAIHCVICTTTKHHTAMEHNISIAIWPNLPVAPRWHRQKQKKETPLQSVGRAVSTN